MVSTRFTARHGSLSRARIRLVRRSRSIFARALRSASSAPDVAAPRFVFFPTIRRISRSTAADPPYNPTGRACHGHPTAAARRRATSQEPDWTRRPGLRGRDVLCLRDHRRILRTTSDQRSRADPAGRSSAGAAVSGEGAPWDVPVQSSFARAPLPIDRGSSTGSAGRLQTGLTPQRPFLGRMHSSCRPASTPSAKRRNRLQSAVKKRDGRPLRPG